MKKATHGSKIVMKLSCTAVLYLALTEAVVAEVPTRSPHPASDHVTLCGLLQLKREFQRAIEHCQAVLKVNATDAQALSNRGSAHLSLGNLDMAMHDFDAAIAVAPKDASYIFNRALVHSAKGQHDRAITDYDTVIRLMPGLAIAYNNRGREFELLGERDRAIADYRKALSVDPSLTIIARNLRRLGIEP